MAGTNLRKLSKRSLRRLVEAAGIEPASEEEPVRTSTSVVTVQLSPQSSTGTNSEVASPIGIRRLVSGRRPRN